ncbi:hypothetical protein KCP70_02325 [Salmonella enterica subsp. enterica]|nr:hypothetical protein KCP70_02325 [Salmonella enterica subsp. enterica]
MGIYAVMESGGGVHRAGSDENTPPSRRWRRWGRKIFIALVTGARKC